MERGGMKEAGTLPLPFPPFHLSLLRDERKWRGNVK